MKGKNYIFAAFYRVTIIVVRFFLFLSVVMLFAACRDEFVDRRVEAYSRASHKVDSISAAEELLELSYILNYELARLDAELGALDSVSALAQGGEEDCMEQLEKINEARRNFERKLLEKEMETYILLVKNKKR